ncbi:hypothetical protein J6590_019399 [Homalodisca vitripennis]|nr:hypothetical protein J6590_019399 [Homalodisca vitripennis]
MSAVRVPGLMRESLFTGTMRMSVIANRKGTPSSHVPVSDHPRARMSVGTSLSGPATRHSYTILLSTLTC